MESRVDRGLCRLYAKWQLLIVSFGESGLVWFYPNIVGVHYRPFFLGNRDTAKHQVWIEL